MARETGNEIGGKALLRHVLMIYSTLAVCGFISRARYQGYAIKKYFSNYFLYMTDVTFDMAHNKMEIHRRHAEQWRLTPIDTGLDTTTGGRRRRTREYVQEELW